MTVTIEEAQKSLSELIDRLQPGEEMVITRGMYPIAQMVSLASTAAVADASASPALKNSSSLQPQFGSCQGKLTILVDDEEHLRDFVDYMP